VIVGEHRGGACEKPRAIFWRRRALEPLRAARGEEPLAGGIERSTRNMKSTTAIPTQSTRGAEARGLVSISVTQ
jgi:hypothetical protein